MRFEACNLLRAVLGGAILLLPAPALVACGWFGPEDVSEVTFFAPEVIAEPGSAPFFVTPFHRFNGLESEAGPLADFTEANLDEWDAFFAKGIDRHTWSTLLYQASLERLDGLIFRLKGRPGAPESPDDEAFLAYPDRRRLIAALYYVGFAKRVEPFAMERAGLESWEWAQAREAIDQEARDTTVAALAEGGRKALDAATIPFLRARYAFQLLRLYFYHGEHDRCVGFFEERRAADFSDGSSVAWRALGYVAGAHYRAKRFAQANYLYSVLFDRYQPLRLSAAWSFRPQEEADWRGSLELARSDRERAVLWQLLGIGADGLRALREIHALDPASDLLPLLLVREVNLAELAVNVTAEVETSSARPVDQAALTAFVAARADEGKVRKPWAWDLAAGHLHALSGDAAAARRHLDRAERRAPADEAVRRQARLSRLLATLQAMPAVDGAAEPMLARELAWVKEEAGRDATSTRAGAFFRWARIHLSGLYRAGGDAVTAVCLHDVGEDPLYADSGQVDRLVEFLRKPGKSAFESLVADLAMVSRDELVEIKGLNALYAGDVETAARLLEGVGVEELPADPFEMHIRDNHDRDAARPDHVTYTKATFVRRLADLLQRAESEPAHAAELTVEAANAFYNITYYGNSRAMYMTPGGHFVRSPRVYDCSRAEAMYRRATERATDRELKARAVFMAAKCELNAYHASDEDRSKGDFVAGRWFATLRRDYSDTAYYREVVHECGYFKTFVEKSAAPTSAPHR